MKLDRNLKNVYFIILGGFLGGASASIGADANRHILDLLIKLLPIGMASILSLFALEGRWIATVGLIISIIWAKPSIKNIIFAIGTVVSLRLGYNGFSDAIGYLQIAGVVITELLLIGFPVLLVHSAIEIFKNIMSGE